jgi:hypothetical protein
MAYVRFDSYEALRIETEGVRNRMSTQSRQTLSTRVRSNLFDHRLGVILAGGDGKRLLPLTRRIAGDNRPKQFCAIMDGETLLAGHVTPAASARCKYSWTVPRPIEQLRAICRSPRPTSNLNLGTFLVLRTDNLLAGKRSSLSWGGCLPLCCPAPLQGEIRPAGVRSRSRSFAADMFRPRSSVCYW